MWCGVALFDEGLMTQEEYARGRRLASRTKGPLRSTFRPRERPILPAQTPILPAQTHFETSNGNPNL